MMGASADDDPFLWDEEQLIQELCTSDRSWSATARQKLPDLGSLAAKFREHEVDGELLLKYEVSMGSVNFLKEFIQEALQIKKLRHQLALKDVIRTLQSRSHAFKLWKSEYTGDQELSAMLSPSPRESVANASSAVAAARIPILQPTASTAASEIGPSCSPGDDHGLSRRICQLDQSTKTQNDLESSHSQSHPVDNPQPTVPLPHEQTINNTSRTSGESHGPILLQGNIDEEEPPKKKRRIAPTMVAPTAEDALTPAFAVNNSTVPANGRSIHQKGTIVNFLGHRHAPTSYLGQVIMRQDLITKAEDGNQKRTQGKAGEFTILPIKFIPSGRRIQVYKAMQKFWQPRLHARRRRDSEENDAKGIEGAGEKAEELDEEEDLLPLFGDSDDELDEETIREIEQDEAEDRKILARARAQKSAVLSKGEVERIVQEYIQSVEEEWNVSKKPRLDLKANRMWRDARYYQNYREQIRAALGRERHLNERASKLSGQILMENWHKTGDVERQCNALEQTVRDRLESRWLAKMLNSQVEPPVPSILPKPKARTKKAYISLEEDEEILSSDLDEDEDSAGFIDDSEQQEHGRAPMDISDSDVDVGQEHNEAHADPASQALDLPTPNSQVLDQQVSLPTESLVGDEASAAGSLSSSVDPQNPNDMARTTPVEAIDIRSPSPVSPTTSDLLPAYTDIANIEKLGVEHWERARDAKRLVIAILCTWGPKRHVLLAGICHNSTEDLWARCILRIRANVIPEAKTAVSTPVAKRMSFGFSLARLFDAFVACTSRRILKRDFKEQTITRLREHRVTFSTFHEFLREAASYFPSQQRSKAGKETPALSRHGSGPSEYDGLYDSGDGQDEGVLRANSDANLDPEEKLILPELANVDVDEDMLDEDTPTKKSLGKKQKQKRKAQIDRDAQNLRLTTFERQKEIKQRRAKLQATIDATGALPSDKSRLIINLAKEDDQAFIYVNSFAAPKIKDHQVQGLRFLWEQIVVDSKNAQGCLLAHTMGLGKTMQVITLLVAIAEASSSHDPAVYSQIPEDLRRPKILVLCPAGLVNNWVEEIALWDDLELLSPTLEVVSKPSCDNDSRVREWASGGGVLVIGYTMFRNVVRDEALCKLLHEEAAIVVGDEAHILKNPKSQVSKATVDFRTRRRIAMTGSPLTNNVLDYYAMINWVAPNYLAGMDEFRREYANPIKEGLYVDSKPYEKRKALKRLEVLKKTVDPKVHRMEISALKNELPNKKEFILSLPLTEVQIKAYTAYVHGVLHDDQVSGLMTGNARIWSLVNLLGQLVAHPSIFQKRLKSRVSKKQSGYQDEEDNVELPERFVSSLLAQVSRRDIEDVTFSWKIVVLLRILDESRRVGDKVLIFSQSLLTLDFLSEIFRLKKLFFSRLDGSTDMKDRQSGIKCFNTADGADVYLISTRAGGVGLNIFGANRVVIFDFKFTPAEELQAVGRAYRIGQTKPVFVYWLIAGGTFEETIHNKSIFKRQLASRVVDKKNPIAWSKRLGEYFAEPKPLEQDNLDKYRGQDVVLDAILNDPKLAGAVRQITSTDSFEEEEEATLTHEEVQETQSMIARNLLRYQNPEEFERLEHERMASQTQFLQPSVPSSQVPPLPSHLSPIQTHNLPSPFSVFRQVIATGSDLNTSTSANQAMRTNHSTNPGPFQPQTNREGAGPIAPVLGAGTFYRSDGQTADASANSENQGGRDKEDNLVESFGGAHAAMKTKGLPVAKPPKELVDQLSGLLQGKHTLERREFLVNLRQAVLKSRRFAEAILSGYYEPTLLATKNRKGFEELGDACDGMDENDFREMIKAAPDHNHKETPADQPRRQHHEQPSSLTNAGRAVTERKYRARQSLGWVSKRESAWNGNPGQQRPQTPERRLTQPRPGDSIDSPHIID